MADKPQILGQAKYFPLGIVVKDNVFNKYGHVVGFSETLNTREILIVVQFPRRGRTDFSLEIIRPDQLDRI